MIHGVTKSWVECRKCNTSEHTIRLQWTDYFPEGSRFYDNHICLECGLYANGGGTSLCADSLCEYKEKYGHVVSKMTIPRDKEEHLQSCEICASWFSLCMVSPFRGYPTSHQEWMNHAKKVRDRALFWCINRPKLESHGVSYDGREWRELNKIVLCKLPLNTPRIICNAQYAYCLWCDRISLVHEMPWGSFWRGVPEGTKAQFFCGICQYCSLTEDVYKHREIYGLLEVDPYVFIVQKSNDATTADHDRGIPLTKMDLENLLKHFSFDTV